MQRRDLITLGIKASGAMLINGAIAGIEDMAWAQGGSQEVDPLDQTTGSRAPRLVDEESGDPDSEPEQLNVNRTLLENLLLDRLSRGVRKDPKTIALKQLEIAYG